MTLAFRGSVALAGSVVVGAVLGVGLVLGAPPRPAAAHPLGNFSVNQYEALTFSPDHVSVAAVVDLAELPDAAGPLHCGVAGRRPRMRPCRALNSVPDSD